MLISISFASLRPPSVKPKLPFTRSLLTRKGYLVNYVESVFIEGFWGDKEVFIELREDLNFLIGPNGSGKTTIINLISAALKADIATLYATQFDKITIRLKTIGVNRKPVIEVEKTVDKSMGSFELRYLVREKTSDKPVIYGIEGPYDERLYRDYYVEKRRRIGKEGARLGNILSEFVEVNWLSIHRSTADIDRRRYREENFESSVDRKLDDISTAFSNYFSLLSSQAELESKNFQEQVFASLLDQKRSGNEIFAEAKSEQRDKSDVVDVLKDLGVSNKKATSSVNAHYKRLDMARERYSNEGALRLEDAIVLSDTVRVRELIEEWRKLQNRRATIFQPKTLFQEIINGMFSGKSILFTERNFPRVRLNSGDDVNVSVLSSGEKQLFILLGEALLQEARAVVFISDEPELSLHVNWQSSLFENVRKLNSSCQVISATHSPDIVGRFQDCVIQVEDCIQNVH